MKIKFYLICFLSALLGLSSCDLEPEVSPSISVDYILMKKLGTSSLHLDIYNIFGAATLKPEGKQVIEAGFMYSSSPNLNATFVDDNRNGVKIRCEIKGDKISFNKEVEEINNISSGTTYCLAYMILSSGQIVTSQTYKVSIYDVVGDIKIITGEADNIGYDKATLLGGLELTGNATLTEYGFYFGNVPNPEGKISNTEGFTGNQLNYSMNVEKLNGNTKYYYRAYGKDITGKVIKGKELSFTTKAKPSIVMNSASISYLGMESYHLDMYNIKGSATLRPEGYQVAEAGFLYSIYYGIDASSVTMPGTAKKIACEIVNNKITLDTDVTDIYNITAGSTYILAYMILKDGTVFVTDTQHISRK